MIVSFAVVSKPAIADDEHDVDVEDDDRDFQRDNSNVAITFDDDDNANAVDNDDVNENDNVVVANDDDDDDDNDDDNNSKIDRKSRGRRPQQQSPRQPTVKTQKLSTAHLGYFRFHISSSKCVTTFVVSTQRVAEGCRSLDTERSGGVGRRCDRQRAHAQEPQLLCRGQRYCAVIALLFAFGILLSGFMWFSWVCC